MLPHQRLPERSSAQHTDDSPCTVYQKMVFQEGNQLRDLYWNWFWDYSLLNTHFFPVNHVVLPMANNQKQMNLQCPALYMQLRQLYGLRLALKGHNLTYVIITFSA